MRAGRVRSGVSLILVLGILSLVTVLAAVVARSIGAGRAAARDAACRIRAGQLLQAAVVRAVEEVDADMQGYTYPCWGAAADAMSSSGTNPCPGLLNADALAIVPRALWDDAATAAAACGWTNALAPDGSVQGRIAYLVINASGLVDANTLDGTNDLAGQLRVGLQDVLDDAWFTADLQQHGGYQSVRELESLNRGVSEPVSNLFVASVALDPDVVCDATNRLGESGAVLLPKFRLNEFQATADYRSDSSFMTGYFARVIDCCVRAGYSTNEAEGFAWNLVNELDGDRVPQGATDTPWLEPVVEAVPLVNEIVVRQVAGVTSPCYEVAVELWYPFHRPDENGGGALFDLQVRVFSNDVVAADQPGSMTASPAWSFEGNGIACTNGTDFICFVSPETSRIEFVEFTTGVPPEPVYQQLGPAHPLWVLARVLVNGERVDEAVGYGRDPGDPAGRRYVRPVTNAVLNPLHNHDIAAWAETEATIGSMNPDCDPWVAGCSGVPVVHRDGPMRRTGDIGYIPVPGPSNAWRDVDLASIEGAGLADLVTARTTNSAQRGLVCISTRQEGVLRALFRDTVIGVPGTTNAAQLGEADVGDLVGWILDANGGGFWSFRHFVEALLAEPGFSGWSPGPGYERLNVKEDSIRDLPDWITFRQNVFIIIAAAQVVPPGGGPALAEQRCIAIVCRDSFTGACRIRSIRPIWQ